MRSNCSSVTSPGEEAGGRVDDADVVLVEGGKVHARADGRRTAVLVEGRDASAHGRDRGEVSWQARSQKLCVQVVGGSVAVASAVPQKPCAAAVTTVRAQTKCTIGRITSRGFLRVGKYTKLLRTRYGAADCFVLFCFVCGIGRTSCAV